MTRHRFIVKNIPEGKPLQVIELTDRDQVKQILKVLRLKEGDELDAIDGRGSLYTCKIQRINTRSVELKVLDTIQTKDDSSIRVSIALSVLKGAKFEWALQKLTEIGVYEIAPIYTERCVVKAGQSTQKHKRWMSIVNEATEQSERIRSPLLNEPIALEQYLTSTRDIKHSLPASDLEIERYIALTRVDARPLVKLLPSQRTPDASPVIPQRHIQIIIGPEGGFTDQEIESAKRSEFIPCNLGKTILRSETAAIVAATIATSFGDFL